MQTIQEIMTRNVEVVRPDAPIREAAEKMRSLDVGSLPVCDGQRLVGMITDRDITIRAIADGRDPSQTPVTEAMTPEIVYCYDDQDVKEVAELMEERQIRRLPIISRDKRLVGIVSLGDLAVDTGKKKMAGQTLTEISKPARPDR
jgi:CBS domain-containing protein